MSRRIGAYVVWDQSLIEPEVAILIERTADLSPVMRTLAYMAAEDGRKQAQGNPDWPDHAPATTRRHGAHTIGVGKGGGFAPTIRPFYGRRNAGWKTRAPHAHLFSLGTKAYAIQGKSVNVWKGASKAKAQQTLLTAKSRLRQPGRPFDYFADGFHDRANDVIAAYFISGEPTS